MIEASLSCVWSVSRTAALTRALKNPWHQSRARVSTRCKITGVRRKMSLDSVKSVQVDAGSLNERLNYTPSLSNGDNGLA
ncbi:hypothetical protein BDW59DRAFT_150495 [Aspergillus cavernicola]|uniref:Uncharacterized protein n=1 Tax=Aspergillus cavernicola TaxID=176166 RepID=A0ABR4HZP7_9EURO